MAASALFLLIVLFIYWTAIASVNRSLARLHASSARVSVVCEGRLGASLLVTQLAFLAPGRSGTDGVGRALGLITSLAMLRCCRLDLFKDSVSRGI